MLGTGNTANEADAVLKTLQAIADPAASQKKVQEWAEREAAVKAAERRASEQVQTKLAEADIRAEEIDTEARRQADDIIANAKAKAAAILKDATDIEAALDAREEEADSRELALSEREKASGKAMAEALELVENAKTATTEADAVKVRANECLERIKSFLVSELDG